MMMFWSKLPFTTITNLKKLKSLWYWALSPSQYCVIGSIAYLTTHWKVEGQNLDIYFLRMYFMMTCATQTALSIARA